MAKAEEPGPAKVHIPPPKARQKRFQLKHTINERGYPFTHVAFINLFAAQIDVSKVHHSSAKIRCCYPIPAKEQVAVWSPI